MICIISHTVFQYVYISINVITITLIVLITHFTNFFQLLGCWFVYLGF